MAHPGSVFADPAAPTTSKQPVRGSGAGRQSLFNQVLPGLFANQSAQGIPAKTFGERFRETFAGGILGPSKRQKEGLKVEQEMETAMIKRRAEGLAGQIRLSGKGDALSFSSVRDAVQAAALGDQQGLSDVASILGAQTGAQRAAGAQRQVTADLTAEQALADAQLAAQGGAFGSNLDVGQFMTLRDKTGAQVAGASKLFNIADTVENLTDFELAMAGPGFAGGTLQGQIEADLFVLLSSMQTLLEIGEPSVLRKSDQELIQGALGNPADLSALLFSREPKTLAAIRRFGDALLETADRSLVGMDQKTIELLSPVLQLQPSPFKRPEGPLSRAGGPGITEIIAPGADPAADPRGRGPGGASEAAVDRLFQ